MALRFDDDAMLERAKADPFGSPGLDHARSFREADLMGDLDPIEKAIEHFTRSLVDPRRALEREILSPEEWLDSRYHSGQLGAYDPTTRTGCWPATRRAFLAICADGVEEAIITGALGTGKAEPISNVLPTPSGLQRMGDLRVGDLVFGADGRPTRIQGVFKRGRLPVCRVTFSDGASVVVSEDHLWSVGAPAQWRRGRFQVKATKDLASDYLSPSGRRKRFIPVVAPLQWETADLPLDPYVLGVLLGSGCAAGVVRFRCEDGGAPAEMQRRLPSGSYLVRSEQDGRAGAWGITTERGQPNLVCSALRGLGLAERRSWDGFIPRMYLLADPTQRLDLLRGLMDSGEAASAALTFSSKFLQLFEGFLFLVQSLGGVARRQKAKESGGAHGRESGQGMPFYCCSVSLPASATASTEVRADRWSTSRKRGPSRSIASIETAGVEEVVCISVEAEDGLYVTENCVVTHNTDVVIRVVIRYIYELSCYINPQALLGLQGHSVIVFALIHMNQLKAKRKLFAPIVTALKKTPYFEQEFRWDKKIEKTSLSFPKGIEVRFCPTDPEAVRSEDLAVLVVDEANFLAVVAKSNRDKEGRTFDAAEEIYDTGVNRQTTRFAGTSLWPAKRLLLSSRDRPGDFLERREREIRVGSTVEGPPEDQFVRSADGKTIVITRALWAAKPQGSYPDKQFRVQIGARKIKSRVLLEDNEQVAQGAKFVTVPWQPEFLEAFRVNPDKALRELAGIAIAGVGRLITDQARIQDIWLSGATNPFTRPVTDLQDGGTLLPELLFKDHKPRCCPDQWRFAHMDPALTTDSLGLAISHTHGSKIVVRGDADSETGLVRRSEPIVCSDLVLEVTAPEGGEIRFSSVCSILVTLRDMGMRIALLTLDSWQSAKIMQDMEDEGFACEKLSLDRDVEPYLNFRDAINEGRYLAPYHPTLEVELQQLLYYRHLGRVDHAPRNSKDVSDACAGSFAGAIKWTPKSEVTHQVGLRVQAY